jgi:hypothetical protein
MRDAVQQKDEAVSERAGLIKEQDNLQLEVARKIRLS